MRRVEVPQAIQAGRDFAEAGYASAFELSTPDARSLTPEQWARATFEGAPALLRPVLVTGWTVGLGLRLGPRPSPSHVLGWRITESSSDSITLEARSRLVLGHNIVVVNDATVVWVTLVRFDQRIARPLWAAAAPIHHQVVPYLLARAGRAGVGT